VTTVFGTVDGTQVLVARAGSPLESVRRNSVESDPAPAVAGAHAFAVGPDGASYIGSDDGLDRVASAGGYTPARISIGNASVVEGDDGAQKVSLMIDNRGGLLDPWVWFETTTGTATPGSDYTPRSGAVRVDVAATLSFVVAADHTDEPNEFFRVKVTSSQPTLERTIGVATITDDDPATGRHLAVGNSAVPEGDVRERIVRFVVTVSKPHTLPVSFTYETVGGTATPGVDFRMRKATMTIPPGKTFATFYATTYTDTKPEPDERFTVRISKPKGASISKPTGTGTILDDD
jgi:hypothetical protein